MDELPAEILGLVADDARRVVQRWWPNLSAAERGEMLTAWDEEQEEAFFSPASDDTPDRLPIVIGGRFIPAEEPLVDPEWHEDYFECLLNHPELLLAEQPYIRLGGVCTTHEKARAALLSGVIPTSFECPLGLAECPMRRLLAKAPRHSSLLTGPFALPLAAPQQCGGRVRNAARS